MEQSSTEIKGQMNIYDFLPDPNKVYDVEIKGICDDAYCPNCDTELDEFRFKDCDKCPYCGTRISWKRWHYMNDEEITNE